MARKARVAVPGIPPFSGGHRFLRDIIPFFTRRAFAAFRVVPCSGLGLSASPPLRLRGSGATSPACHAVRVACRRFLPQGIVLRGGQCCPNYPRKCRMTSWATSIPPFRCGTAARSAASSQFPGCRIRGHQGTAYWHWIRRPRTAPAQPDPSLGTTSHAERRPF